VPWTWFAWRDALARPLLLVADLVALIIPVAVPLTALAIGWTGWHRRSRLVAAVSWALFGAAATIQPWLPTDRGPAESPSRIVFANLRFDNESPRAAEAVIAMDGDVVVTAETNGAMYVELVSSLGRPDGGGGDDGVCTLEGAASCESLNVWSKAPARQAGQPDAVRRLRGARLEVDGPGGQFVLYAVHARSPNPFLAEGGTSPSRHRSDLEALLDEALSEDLPVVIVGDLNLSDRQSLYRSFDHHLVDAMRVEGAGPTARSWYLRPLLLRIDHIFTSEGWCAQEPTRFDVADSDHRGVAVEVGPCAHGR
jgi:endonuclease/exonuclease/phosphatase (EEP) superfamily protein YafD